jgi:hypothetical protein
MSLKTARMTVRPVNADSALVDDLNLMYLLYASVYC